MENNPCKRVSTDWEAVELLLSWQRAHKNISIDWDMCRESIQKLPRNLDGSRIYWECIELIKSKEIWLDGSKKLSRIYREETQKSWWIEISSRSVEKRRKKGSIIGNLSTICQKLSSLKKEGFSKKGKTHRDECNKQATQT